MEKSTIGWPQFPDSRSHSHGTHDIPDCHTPTTSEHDFHQPHVLDNRHYDSFRGLRCLLSKQIEVFKQTLLIQKNVPISISLESNQTDIDEMVHMDTRSRILVGLKRNVLHQTWFLYQDLLVLPLFAHSPQFVFHL